MVVELGSKFWADPMYIPNLGGSEGGGREREKVFCLVFPSIYKQSRRAAGAEKRGGWPASPKTGVHECPRPSHSRYTYISLAALKKQKAQFQAGSKVTCPRSAS